MKWFELCISVLPQFSKIKSDKKYSNLPDFICIFYIFTVTNFFFARINILILYILKIFCNNSVNILNSYTL